MTTTSPTRMTSPRGLALALVALTCALAVLPSSAADKSAGFRKDIDWLDARDIKKFDFKSNTKPIVYLFSQPWCGACNQLKKNFASAGDSVVAASKDFVMVSISGDDNNKYGQEYQPDGGYIPRVIFASPNGKVNKEIFNKGSNPKFKYYYTSAGQIVSAMKRAKDILGAGKDEL